MNANATLPQIQHSWQRCIEEYRLDPGVELQAPCLSEPEILHAKERLDDLLHLADPIWERLKQLGQNTGYCVLVADADGVVLREYSDSNAGSALTDKGLRVGTVWTEHLVGTNGLGTCLASGEALTVYEKEHFGRELQRFSCSTAPLISPDGDVIGALDISTFASGNKESQGLALNLVCDAADQIETLMFRHAFGRHHLMALVPSVTTEPQLSNAMLAINDAGWVVGATSMAVKVLGMRDRSSLIGLALARLTGKSLEAMYQDRQPVPGGRKFWFRLLQSANQRVGKGSVSLISMDRGSSNIDQPTTPREDSALYQAAGEDPQLLRNADICHRVLDRNINILLQGETGTGKEVWAKAIHDSSKRKSRPFVTLNCAAIPESLIESELFGYGAGTFTGGLRGGKTGKIEASSGGTLFLDEIGDMPLALQARLLRVLAEQEITPLGQLTPVKLDLHVICATHRNLLQMAEDGEFRSDLFYRISGVKVSLPALRERQDKSELIDRLLQAVVKGEEVSLTASARQVLERYAWPGNIRQLKNALEFAHCMCERNSIRITDLPDEVFGTPESSGLADQMTGAALPPERLVSLPGQRGTPSEARAEKEVPEESKSLAELSAPARPAPLDEEHANILAALESNRWVVSKTAEVLGISRSTLHRKMRKYNLYDD